MHTSILLSLLLCISIISQSAKAQLSYAGNPHFSNDTTTMPVINLGEVVVESTREKRSLQDIPVSASVIPQSTIEQQQIEGLSDLTSRVPNLYMPSYGSKLTSPIYIRGIGSRIESPSIGLYVDYIPQFDKSSFDFEFFDVERIEVLRGPQGATHGRNNMGGIIHVFTQTPINAPLAIARFTAGNYGLYTYGLQINNEITDRTAIQISGQKHQKEGYFTNEYSGNKVDGLDVISGRLKLIHNWKSSLNTEFMASFEESEQGGYPYGRIDPVSGTRQPINYNEPSGYDRTLVTAGLLNRYSIGSWTFRSASSAQYIDDLQTIDQDFTEIPQFLVTQPQEQYNLSQEITANYRTDSLNVTFGVFGFLLDLDKKMNMWMGPAKNVIARREYLHRNAGFAFFSQASFKNSLIRGLTITPGIRLDWEEASQYYHQTMEANGNFIPTMERTYDTSMTFSEILPRIAVDYQVTPMINTYFSVTKGYKAGGFNITIEREDDRTYNAEQSWSYEAGIKSKWLLDLFRFSAAAFYIDWTNQQVVQAVPSEQGTMLKNAGKSTSKGFEGEFTIRPINQLEAYFSFGTTEAIFQAYDKQTATDTINLKGFHLPYAPKYTIHTGINLSLPVHNIILKKVEFNMNHQVIGKIYWEDTNENFQSAYNITNANISFHIPKANISIWAKNLWDTDYNIFEFVALRNRFAQAGSPAHFGVNVKVIIN